MYDVRKFWGLFDLFDPLHPCHYPTDATHQHVGTPNSLGADVIKEAPQDVGLFSKYAIICNQAFQRFPIPYSSSNLKLYIVRAGKTKSVRLPTYSFSGLTRFKIPRYVPSSL